MAGNGWSKRSNYSRRSFLTRASQWSALFAAYPLVPLPELARALSEDSRVGQTPVVDKGFAAVRKVGDGLYATISDTSKGLATMCNGGFLCGKDAALLIEGFVSPAGAAFQHEIMRSLSKAPVMGAVETHYHYDHSLGNAYYGANGISVWAHTATARRIWESYAAMQGTDRAAVVGPLEDLAKAAKTEAARQHATQYAAAVGNIFNATNATVIAVPNRPLDPAKLPLKFDLGGVVPQVETYPGHSGTDIIVRVPEQNVVYAGDLLFSNMYPVTFDQQASVSGWRSTLRTFLSWGKDTIFVPGHGQICGPEGVQLSLDLFDDIEQQAQKFHKAGVPAEEAADQYVVPDKFKNVGIFSWNHTIGPTIVKLYKEWA